MYKKKKSKRRVVITVLLIFLFIAVMLFDLSQKEYIFINKEIREIVDNVTSFIVMPFSSFNDAESWSENVFNETLLEENKLLKSQLELNELVTDYTVVNATVIKRDINYWFHNFTIDKGIDDGVQNGMMVVTKNGLIGKINKVTGNSSEVKLITGLNENYQISVVINASDEELFGVANSYVDNMIVVNGIEKYNNINIGDKVSTSGLGGVFSKGIYIGEVEKVVNDANGIDQNVYVKPFVNYNNIYYVSVLMR